MDDEPRDLRLMTADIVAAFVGSRNHVTAAELPNLISTVHAALSGLQVPTEPTPVKQEPAVPLRKAVQPDAITCLFDGKSFKSLKRHLANEHQMTPAEYRAHWGLPKDSAMVAPNYAKARSDLARLMGLGRKAAAEPVGLTGRDASPPGDETPPVQAKRGRRKVV
jgi:predicted transcriptional regulator